MEWQMISNQDKIWGIPQCRMRWTMESREGIQEPLGDAEDMTHLWPSGEREQDLMSGQGASHGKCRPCIAAHWPKRVLEMNRTEQKQRTRRRGERDAALRESAYLWHGKGGLQGPGLSWAQAAGHQSCYAHPPARRPIHRGRRKAACDEVREEDARRGGLLR